MYIRTISTISCTSLLLASHIVNSQQSFANIRVVTGLSLGYSGFSFPEKLDHDISFPSANIPIALTLNNWQLSVNVSSTLAKADIAEEEDIGKASRKDLDLTLGYTVTKNWSLFAGFKYGKTEMTFIPRDMDMDEDDDDAGEAQETVDISNDSYSQKGPFVGVNYNWKFERAGSFSMSLAYASLDSNNNFAANTDEEEEEELTEFDDLTGQVKGATRGFSYGLSWTMPLSSNVLFQTRFKINDYQQDIVVDGEQFENIDETFTTLHVGLAYVF